VSPFKAVYSANLPTIGLLKDFKREKLLAKVVVNAAMRVEIYKTIIAKL
jgi:hypothetical protein